MWRTGEGHEKLKWTENRGWMSASQDWPSRLRSEIGVLTRPCTSTTEGSAPIGLSEVASLE